MRGADSIGYELHEAAPDARAVYVPTGGGGLAAAIGRGLGDCGNAAAVVVCQPQGCAPIVRHLDGEIDRPVIDRCYSRISALQLPGPPDGDLAAGAVRRSSGWGTMVPDDAIRAAQRRPAARPPRGGRPCGPDPDRRRHQGPRRDRTAPARPRSPRPHRCRHLPSAP